MAMPIEKVEVGFDTTFSGVGDFFTLNDATKGVLDNTTYKLAGLQFIDVTNRVKQFNISRGRSGIFSAFPAAQANIEFNNHDRAFDPLYTQSPFAGNIVPRREIRVTTANSVQYTGWIDDWAFSYTSNGDSIAEAIAYDAQSIFSGQTLALGTPVSELSGARINKVLDEIGWLDVNRNIDTGVATLSTAVIEANTNAMSYLQNIALSEAGFVFVGKDGKINFVERTDNSVPSSYVTFGGNGVPFQNLDVSYGSDNLYNQIVFDRIGGGTVTVTDNQSITDYGLRTLTQSGLLLNDDSELTDLGLLLATKYSQPEYRFSSLEVAVHKLSPAQQDSVLSLELGDIGLVEFTPNGIGSAIKRFVQVISINHTVNPQTHFIEYGFQSIELAFWRLSDPTAGRLSAGNVLAA